MPPIKKKVMQNPNTAPAATTTTKEETTMAAPIKRVPTKAPVKAATTAAPVKKAPAAPKAVTTAAPVKKAPAAPAKAAPKAVTPAKKTVAAAPKATAKKTVAAAPKQRAVLGGKTKNQNKTVFEINEGGRTTRDSFNHLAHERILAAGIPVDSKKTTTDVVNIVEELLVDITRVSSFKFMNAMFKRSWNKARVYDLPTTEYATLVPAHYKVQYSRYAEITPEDFLKGDLLEDGSFLPLGEEESIVISDADVNPDADEVEEVEATEEVQYEEVEDENVEDGEEV